MILVSQYVVEVALYNIPANVLNEDETKKNLVLQYLFEKAKISIKWLVRAFSPTTKIVIYLGEFGRNMRIKSQKIDPDDLLPSFHEILNKNFDSFVKDISTEYPDLLVYSDKMQKSSITSINRFLKKLKDQDESIGKRQKIILFQFFVRSPNWFFFQYRSNLYLIPFWWLVLMTWNLTFLRIFFLPNFINIWIPLRTFQVFSANTDAVSVGLYRSACRFVVYDLITKVCTDTDFGFMVSYVDTRVLAQKLEVIFGSVENWTILRLLLSMNVLKGLEKPFRFRDLILWMRIAKVTPRNLIENKNLQIPGIFQYFFIFTI